MKPTRSNKRSRNIVRSALVVAMTAVLGTAMSAVSSQSPNDNTFEDRRGQLGEDAEVVGIETGIAKPGSLEHDYLQALIRAYGMSTPITYTFEWSGPNAGTFHDFASANSGLVQANIQRVKLPSRRSDSTEVSDPGFYSPWAPGGPGGEAGNEATVQASCVPYNQTGGFADVEITFEWRWTEDSDGDDVNDSDGEWVASGVEVMYYVDNVSTCF